MSKLVRKIQTFNEGRLPERLAMKYANMRSGPFVFLRATCHLYYDRLPDAAILAKAPPAWICGDLHLENYGSYKGDNRQVYFDMNDFDEGVLAPASWDAVRMVSSILVGREALKASETEARALGALFIDCWADGLADGHARWIEREIATGPIRDLLTSLKTRQRIDLLSSRTMMQKSRRVLKIDGRKLLPASREQRARMTAAIAGFAASEPDPKFYKVLDVARRVAGNGSLGLDRYLVLIQGKGAPDKHYLLDVKQSPPSALAKMSPLKQPKWRNEAARAIAVQRRMQAVPLAFLHDMEIDGVAYLLREMQPIADRVSLAEAARQDGAIESLVSAMADCLASAQLRSSGRQGSATADELMAFGAKSKWRSELLDAAIEAARQVEADWAAYSQAYDDGAFAIAAQGAG